MKPGSCRWENQVAGDRLQPAPAMTLCRTGPPTPSVSSSMAVLESLWFPRVSLGCTHYGGGHALGFPSAHITDKVSVSFRQAKDPN